MKKFVFASLIAIAAAAPISSAFADQFEDRGMDTISIRGHHMKVHAMRMSDGTVVYGMTRDQLSLLGVNWRAESRH